MTITGPRGFRRQTAGATTIEFAITLVPLLMFVMGILQAGFMFWRWQALESTAIDAARCAALNATSCQSAATTPANTQNYAVTAAQLRGLSGITASNVTVATGAAARAACGSTTATVVSVAVSHNFGVIYLINLPSTLTASACFPLASG